MRHEKTKCVRNSLMYVCVQKTAEILQRYDLIRCICLCVYVCHIAKKMTARTAMAPEKILKTNVILAWFRDCIHKYINTYMNVCVCPRTRPAKTKIGERES